MPKLVEPSERAAASLERRRARPPSRDAADALDVRAATRDSALALGVSPHAMSRLDRALIQFRRATSGAAAPDRVHAAAARGLSGAGGPLPFAERIQASFGRHDVSGVTAHRGPAAAEAARALGARAYATGDSVVLGPDGSDLHTVAHEAAHVVQQRGGVSLKGGVGQSGDAYERHADDVADRVVRGQSAEALLDRFAGDGATGARRVQLQDGPDAAQDAAADLQWVRSIVVTAGVMSEEAADAWLAEVEPARLRQAMSGRVDATPAPRGPQDAPAHGHDEPTGVMNAADGAGGRGPRSRPLDWSRSAGDQPAGIEGGGGASMGEQFQEGRRAELLRTFGVDDIERVQRAIRVLELGHRTAEAQQLRGLLFRCNQYAVIDTLDVEDSARYQPRGNTTFCNVYAHDVVTALGGYLPRVWWTDAAIARIEQGEQVAPVLGQTVTERSGDGLNRWLRSRWGRRFGWEPVATAREAQELANSGHLVITSASGHGQSGHINVIVAEDAERDRTAHREEGPDGEEQTVAPLSSQAGSYNYDYSNRADRAADEERSPAERQYHSHVRWWEDEEHHHGSFYVWRGASHSPIATPEELGQRPELPSTMR